MASFFNLICYLVCITLTNSMSYNESAALSAVYYSFGAYCDADCLQTWNCTKFCAKNPHFALHSVVIGTKHSLQAFTGYDAQKRQIVISFRGTKYNKNMLVDIDWEQMYFKEGESYNTGSGNWAIHEGFYWGLRELYSRGLYASLEALFTQYNDANVLITGHSLGGALAQMLALMFATVPTFDSLSIRHVEIITFGAPRWGSKDVVTYFNTLPYANWRVVNKYDIIPTLPWESMGDYGYFHPKSEVRYTEWGTLQHQMCDEDGKKTSDCGYVEPSRNMKYHLYYLNVFEDECGENKPNAQWFSQQQPSTTDTEYNTLPVVNTIHDVSVFNDTDLNTQYVSTTIAHQGIKEQKKQHSDWTVNGFICVGALAFGCLLVVTFCCLFAVKLCQNSKRKYDDNYVAIYDV